MQKFESVTYLDAVRIMKERQGSFLKNIPYNNANVYVLKDSSLLVVPLNPYATALIVHEESSLEEMIKANFFPVKDTFNRFYDANKQKIENLNESGETLIADLLSYLKSNGISPENDPSGVDGVYNFLKAKRTLNKYKLHFILYVAKFIIKGHDAALKVGLLRDKQVLNPIVSIVLVKKGDNGTAYFNLQHELFERRGYYGVQDVIRNVDQFKKSEDALNEVYRVFEWPGR